MHVVSFYTGDGRFAELAAKLRASCERFNIPHSIEQLPSDNDWIKNLMRKPAFMLRKLEELKKPIVWLDADCEVMQYPTMLDENDYDLQIFNWMPVKKPEEHAADPQRLVAASGVVYLNYTTPAQRLLYQWIAACKSTKQKADDQILDVVYREKCKGQIKCRWLPPPYNRMDSYFPEVEPVINHIFKSGAFFFNEGDLPPVVPGTLPLE